MRMVQASHVADELIRHKAGTDEECHEMGSLLVSKYGPDAEVCVMHPQEALKEAQQLVNPPGYFRVAGVTLLCPQLIAEWPDLLEGADA